MFLSPANFFANASLTSALLPRRCSIALSAAIESADFLISSSDSSSSSESSSSESSSLFSSSSSSCLRRRVLRRFIIASSNASSMRSSASRRSGSFGHVVARRHRTVAERAKRAGKRMMMRLLSFLRATQARRVFCVRRREIMCGFCRQKIRVFDAFLSTSTRYREDETTGHHHQQPTTE